MVNVIITWEGSETASACKEKDDAHDLWEPQVLDLLGARKLQDQATAASEQRGRKRAPEELDVYAETTRPWLRLVIICNLVIKEWN